MIYERKSTRAKGGRVYHYDVVVPEQYAERFGLEVKLHKGQGRLRRSSRSHKKGDAVKAQVRDQELVDKMLPLEGLTAPEEKPEETLPVLLQAFLDYKAGAGYSVDRFEDCLPHLERLLGNPAASAVVREDVERFVQARRDEAAPATVQTELRFLRAAFNWAVRHGRLERNPSAGVLVKDGNAPRERLITSDEFERLLRALELPGCNIRDHVETSLLTGLRLGELRNLREKDLDFHAETLWLPKTKTGPARVVPMHERVREILWGLVQGIEDRKPFASPVNLGRPFRRAVKRAGLSDIRWHDLRHAAAGHLYESGADPQTVATVLGHADPRTALKIYARVSPEHVKAAVRRLPVRGKNSAHKRHMDGKKEGISPGQDPTSADTLDT